MLIVFKAQDCSSVTMLQSDAHKILSFLGKNAADAEGVVTVEQLPQAIARLREAVAADRAQAPAPRGEPAKADEKDEQEPPVRLYQRAQPVLLLVECATKSAAPVTWGV